MLLRRSVDGDRGRRRVGVVRLERVRDRREGSRRGDGDQTQDADGEQRERRKYTGAGPARAATGQDGLSPAPHGRPPSEVASAAGEPPPRLSISYCIGIAERDQS